MEWVPDPLLTSFGSSKGVVSLSLFWCPILERRNVEIRLRRFHLTFTWLGHPGSVLFSEMSHSLGWGQMLSYSNSWNKKFQLLQPIVENVSSLEVKTCLPWNSFWESVLLCDLEPIGSPSIFKFTRKGTNLTRMFPTLDLMCEENTVWRYWKIDYLRWTPEVTRKWSVSWWVFKNKRLIVLGTTVIKETLWEGRLL